MSYTSLTEFETLNLIYCYSILSILYFSLFEILNYAVISPSRHISHQVVSSCNIIHTFTVGGKSNFSLSLIITDFMALWKLHNFRKLDKFQSSGEKTRRRSISLTERISIIVQCVCVGVFMYTYKYTHTHTHTHIYIYIYIYIYITKLRGLSPHANYTDRAAAAGRRS